MNVVRELYSGYGDGAPSGNGPDQGLLQVARIFAQCCACMRYNAFFSERGQHLPEEKLPKGASNSSRICAFYVVLTHVELTARLHHQRQSSLSVDNSQQVLFLLNDMRLIKINQENNFAQFILQSLMLC
jgi:hypothetical protein